MPDVFGQETPLEASARVRAGAADRRKAFSMSPQGQTQGGQFGSSLGAIFGPALNKFVQTRSARKKAVEGGMTEEEAKKKIPYGYTDVRRAEKAQEFSSDASVLLDALNAKGGNEVFNRSQVMQVIALRLRNAGELKAGQDMKLRSELMVNEEFERLSNLDKISATTDSARERANQLRQDILFKKESESDTFAQINNGKLEHITEVFKGDIAIRQAMVNDAGFIKIGPGGISAQLSEAALTRTPPVNTEELGFQFGMLDALEVMQRVAPDVGFGTPILALMAERGIDLFGSGKFIDAVAHGKAIRAGIQSIIKGIPSNYDASIFEAMIPNLFRFQDGEFYQAQIDVLTKQTKDLIILNIASHKGSREPMPMDILLTAARFGIDVGAIKGIPISEQFAHVRALEEIHRKGFAALTSVQPEGDGENAAPTNREIIDSYLTPK